MPAPGSLGLGPPAGLAMMIWSIFRMSVAVLVAYLMPQSFTQKASRMSAWKEWWKNNNFLLFSLKFRPFIRRVWDVASPVASPRRSRLRYLDLRWTGRWCARPRAHWCTTRPWNQNSRPTYERQIEGQRHTFEWHTGMEKSEIIKQTHNKVWTDSRWDMRYFRSRVHARWYQYIWPCVKFAKFQCFPNVTFWCSSFRYDTRGSPGQH